MARLPYIWWLLGAVFIAMSGVLAVNSPAFGEDVDLIDMPIATYIAGYALAGILFLALIPLTRQGGSKGLLIWIIGAGILMRLIQFTASPVLEDDYYRYLWDGAVTAEGGNPFRYSPNTMIDDPPAAAPYAELTERGDYILERVNYPQYRTIYPPVTQAFFALAHKIGPFSLTAWRIVLLALDIMIAGLILHLLATLGRPLVAVVLYWWNPLVVKEIFNSVHMEPVVVIFVLAALAALASNRRALAAAALALGAGAKLWPVLLMPLALRAAWPSRSKLLAIGAVFAVLTAALFLPVLLTRLDGSSGFVAYAEKWQTNSALFLILEWLAGLWPWEWPVQGMIARGLAGAMLLAAVVWICRRPIGNDKDLLQRAFLCLVALFLLSPVQFPWYFLWVAPLLPLFPLRGLLLAVPLLPLYYGYFHLQPRDMADLQTYGLVWLSWIPVWAVLGHDYLRQRG
ncbi:MAG: glycosyltransferase 87 family protein [Pseudomonadota bacterium]